MSVKDAILQIVEEIDAKLLGSSNERLKGIPCLNSLSSMCLQAYVTFAYPLSSPQSSRIVV